MSKFSQSSEIGDEAGDDITVIWKLGVIIQKNALRNQIKYFTNEGVMVIMK